MVTRNNLFPNVEWLTTMEWKKHSIAGITNKKSKTNI